MTKFEVFQVGQSIITLLGVALLWSSRGGFQLSNALSRLTGIETRMDRAGKELSELAGKVQTMPLVYHRLNECEKRLDAYEERIERLAERRERAR